MEKFNRKKLIALLSKVNLRGLTNKVWINNTEEDTEVYHVIDDSGNLIIDSILKGNLFNSGEGIGIYDVQMFLRYLELFDEENLTFKFIKNDDKENTRLVISHKNKNINYVLARKENISIKDEFKKDPYENVSYEFSFDKDFIQDVLKSLEVSQTKFVNFVIKDDNFFLYVGDMESKEHLIKIKIDDFKKIKELGTEKITFHSNFFMNILRENNDKVDFKLVNGLLIYESKDKDIKSVYYQRSLITEE